VTLNCSLGHRDKRHCPWWTTDTQVSLFCSLSTRGITCSSCSRMAAGCSMSRAPAAAPQHHAHPGCSPSGPSPLRRWCCWRATLQQPRSACGPAAVPPPPPAARPAGCPLQHPRRSCASCPWLLTCLLLPPWRPRPPRCLQGTGEGVSNSHSSRSKAAAAGEAEAALTQHASMTAVMTAACRSLHLVLAPLSAPCWQPDVPGPTITLTHNQCAPACTSLHQPAPACTSLHQPAPACTSLHQVQQCTRGPSPVLLMSSWPSQPALHSLLPSGLAAMPCTLSVCPL
jgi:hypothetical protein